jgi:hypothetical protein
MAILYRKLLSSDSLVSLFLHGVKMLLALGINFVVLKNYSTSEYVLWSVISSLMLVASASDFGIGQYTVTKLINSTHDRWGWVVFASLISLIPLALISFIFVYIALDGQSLVFKFLMALFLSLRIMTIPYSSVLNASNQYKIRKLIEVVFYFISMCCIVMVVVLDGHVSWALLSLNAAFMVAGFAVVCFAIKRECLDVSDYRSFKFSFASKIYSKSVPFLINNLIGLLTYGGFIWISNFNLAELELAKLSILHTFVLASFYQIYDVVLRSRQADLINFKHVRRMNWLNNFLMTVCVICGSVMGSELLNYTVTNFVFSRWEVAVFSIFLAFELGYLFIQSIVQVNNQLAYLLVHYSLVKFSTQGLAIFLYWLHISDSKSDVFDYLSLLALFSGAGYIVCRVHLSSRLRL